VQQRMMMGLCRSCFCRSHLSRSPEASPCLAQQEQDGDGEGEELEGDVEKLLRKPSPRLSLVTDQPASEDEKWRGGEGGDLEKSETGDSGTCVDEILSPGALGTSDSGTCVDEILSPGALGTKEEEEEERKGEEYEEVFEAEDLVQLTVSSLASLGMLEDVPEHADEDNSDLVDEQATVTTTLSLIPEPLHCR